MKPYNRNQDAKLTWHRPTNEEKNMLKNFKPKLGPQKPGSRRQGPPGHHGFDKTEPYKKPSMPGGMPGPITAPGMKPPSGPPTGPPGAGKKPNPWNRGGIPPEFGRPKPKDPLRDRNWKYGFQKALFGDQSVDPRTHKNWQAKMPSWMRSAVQKGGADWRSHLDDAGRGHAKNLQNRIRSNVMQRQFGNRGRRPPRPRPPRPGMRPGRRPPRGRRRPPRGRRGGFRPPFHNYLPGGRGALPGRRPQLPGPEVPHNPVDFQGMGRAEIGRRIDAQNRF